LDRLTRLRNLLPVAIAAGLLWGPAVRCAAGPPVTYNACQTSGGWGAEVRVADKAALRLYTANGGLSPLQRADIVASRLQSQQGRGVSPSSYRAEATGSQWWVVSGSEKLVHATEEEARAHKSSPRALAASWAENLRRLLSLPALFFDPSALTVPYKETRTVQIGGWGEGPIEVACQDPIVTLQVGSDGRSLTVSGDELGDTVVEAVQGTLRAELKVVVMKWAGRFAQAEPAQVTGVPTDSESLALAVANAARRSVILEDGASLSVVGPQEIRSDASGSVALAKATAKGPGLLERTEEVAVPLVRVEPPSRAPELLLYCNDPEKVTRAGPLFHSQITRPSRLFVHHINSSGRALNLSIYASCAADQEASVHIIGGRKAASGDVIGTGLQAVSRFMENFRARSGCVISIAPGSVERIAAMRMSRGAVASAVYDVIPVSGGPVRLTVVAESPDSTAAMGSGYYDGLDESDHIYPQTARRVLEEYEVGKRWAFVTIGKEPLQNLGGRTALRGDYGILYDIDVRVKNPHPESKRIVVEFEAAAGPAGIVAWVNGEKHSIGRLATQREATLASLIVPPNSERTVKIETMPLGGAAYPARIIVREG
jgi:hypothetical protein